MRGYDEYDTAPLDQLDDYTIDNAGPCPTDAFGGGYDLDIDLAELPF